MTTGKLNTRQVQMVVDYLNNFFDGKGIERIDDQDAVLIDTTSMAYDISDLIEENSDTATIEVQD